MPEQKTEGKSGLKQPVAEDMDQASYLARKYGIRDGEVTSSNDSTEAEKKQEPSKK